MILFSKMIYLEPVRKAACRSMLSELENRLDAVDTLYGLLLDEVEEEDAGEEDEDDEGAEQEEKGAEEEDDDDDDNDDVDTARVGRVEEQERGNEGADAQEETGKGNGNGGAAAGGRGIVGPALQNDPHEAAAPAPVSAGVVPKAAGAASVAPAVSAVARRRVGLRPSSSGMAKRGAGETPEEVIRRQAAEAEAGAAAKVAEAAVVDEAAAATGAAAAAAAAALAATAAATAAGSGGDAEGAEAFPEELRLGTLDAVRLSRCPATHRHLSLRPRPFSFSLFFSCTQHAPGCNARMASTPLVDGRVAGA